MGDLKWERLKRNFYNLDGIRDYAQKHVATLSEIKIINMSINRLEWEKKTLLANLKQSMGEIVIK
jgi:hypothetical protein